MTIQKKQKGVVLVISLIMLLVITLIGVSAVKMSTLDTQVAGNSIYSALVFQGAESALGKVLSDKDLSNVDTAASARNLVIDVPADYFNPAEAVSAGATLNSKATIQFDGVLDSPVLNNVANSSEFNYQIFRVIADSKLSSSSARDVHTDGRAVQIPKQ
ncbi:PilX N-terminal domain-containing pilus assembly protein [uncultured Cocleimonas sp.]|uniref:pilus assembly PilX family protein n=1 Tax=uncultured Cocleimonas sp. TaxID=1051587 RepID=UPI002632812B|nr:PilX N-terminal domain-containing pilus assembly protein [uncultured Cocleimonas sp.]